MLKNSVKITKITDNTNQEIKHRNVHYRTQNYTVMASTYGWCKDVKTLATTVLPHSPATKEKQI
jgi:hypothetical protein